MTSIAPSAFTTWDNSDDCIRVTGEGQPSVYDMIKVIGGRKDPRKTWERILESHPEVALKCHNLQFPGPGQRPTPVTNTKEDAFYILGLLPGAVGQKYREDAARLFTAYLDNPAKVASELVKRLTPEQQERLEARLRTINGRHKFTHQLKEHGVDGHGYARCTNAIYIPITGLSASGLRQHFASKSELPVRNINPRDHMTTKQLGDIETAERVAAGQLRRQNAFGNSQVERVVYASAEYTRQLLDGEIDIPSLA